MRYEDERMESESDSQESITFSLISPPNDPIVITWIKLRKEYNHNKRKARATRLLFDFTHDRRRWSSRADIRGFPYCVRRCVLDPASEIILFQGNNHDGNSLIHREVWCWPPKLMPDYFSSPARTQPAVCGARKEKWKYIHNTVSEMTFWFSSDHWNFFSVASRVLLFALLFLREREKVKSTNCCDKIQWQNLSSLDNHRTRCVVCCVILTRVSCFVSMWKKFFPVKLSFWKIDKHFLIIQIIMIIISLHGFARLWWSENKCLSSKSVLYWTAEIIIRCFCNGTKDAINFLIPWMLELVFHMQIFRATETGQGRAGRFFDDSHFSSLWPAFEFGATPPAAAPESDMFNQSDCLRCWQATAQPRNEITWSVSRAVEKFPRRLFLSLASSTGFLVIQ